jgi:YfiH family protein
MNLPVVEAGTLARQSGLKHGFFTRQGGVSEGLYASLNCGLGSRDARDAVFENRRRVAAHLGVPPDFMVNGYQVHSAEVAVAETPWRPGQAPHVDALVTRTPGLALAVSTADCAPVLFADPDAGVVGAAHAGWKGALTGVLDATLRAMERLGAERARVVAAIGPAISGASYEVGPEFRERFLSADPGNEAFFRNGERLRFDLPAYVAVRLMGLGIREVEDVALCTYRDEARFFSFRRATHRREPDYGRLFSAIVLTA